MAETTQFTIGVGASCSDGVCGEVTRVVVDPVAETITHLVVEPKHTQGLGRLVPLALVEAKPDEVRLHCTAAQFEQLGAAEEIQFLSGSGGYLGYGPGEMFSWPYYALGGMGLAAGLGISDVPQAIIHETLPLGEIAVRRGEHVHASDGDIGRVQGLVIDARNHHVTHVLLQEGHLWGRKEVAIPINAVTGVDDGIRLNITKQEVQELPPVDINHPSG
jgi:sporulation protein YlmC with PRC-barrel domain